MTTNNFVLDERLKNDGFELAELKLCKVILVNNILFPWVILVPRQHNLKEIIDLSAEDRVILLEEISLTSAVMKAAFSPDKLNIAALGNIVEQLHIHIIARFKKDHAWPEPVFGKERHPYSIEEKNNLIIKLQSLILKIAHTT